MRCFIPILCFLLNSCDGATTTSSVLSTSDSVLYVVGKVVDEYGVALSNATVNLNDLESTTDVRGCFLFDGVYPEHPIKIKISKVGYKAVREEKPYSGYLIEAMLTKSGSSKPSHLVWTELDISDPNLNVNC